VLFRKQAREGGYRRPQVIARPKNRDGGGGGCGRRNRRSEPPVVLKQKTLTRWGKRIERVRPIEREGLEKDRLPNPTHLGNVRKKTPEMSGR